MNPHWKNRVISVPIAIENITNVWDIVHDFITRVEDVCRIIRERVHGAPEIEPENIPQLAELPSKLGRVGEKILAIAALVIDSLQAIEDFIGDLQSIVDDIHQLRIDLENLDGVFLQQNNPRRYVSTKRRARIAGN